MTILYENSGKPWSYDEKLKAHLLYKNGKNPEEIGEELKRSKGAVQVKMSEEGLYYHPPLRRELGAIKLNI